MRSQYLIQTNARQLLPVVFFICLAFSSLNAAEDLKTQYAKTAEEVLQTLRVANVQTVGVLKFSACIGDGPFPASLGNLNMRLAEKLELALVLAQSADESHVGQQVGIVRNASKVAGTIPNASHVTSDGRRLLFSKKYPLAWEFRGQSDVVPDGLIVGVAQIKGNLQSMEIELLLLKKGDLNLHPLVTLQVPTDLEDLMDSGESFTTRGLFDQGTITETAKAVELVTKKSADIRQENLGTSPRQNSRKHPLAAANDAPIKFEIWYDNQSQPIEFRDGAAFVKEPSEGQRVMFVVRRKGADQQRYGILMRVNGENTLYRRRNPDLQTALWILEPSEIELSVRGFQLDNGSREEFRVLSDSESKDHEIDYGRETGMIALVVFREGNKVKPFQTERDESLAVQSNATLPEVTAPTLGNLAQRLFAQMNDPIKTRGLIKPGKTESAAVEVVTFQRDVMPVMATSIRYYNSR